ncbi:MAG TPA: short chain dehydrogenase [Salinivirgaceae bacterium]|nr:short chain dehydrogenase [Salinivirgaceae bacterium]
MKAIVVGYSGTIGKLVFNALISRGHDVIAVAQKSGDFKVDIRQSESVTELFEKIGRFDALVCCAGKAYFGPFEEMTLDDFYTGFDYKVMGQVHLVKIGLNYINPGGSFTLTTGITCDDPIPYGTGLAMANGALNAFVKNTAINISNGVRINAVSPGLLKNAVERLGQFFPGHTPVEPYRVVDGYIKSVEGKINGEIIRIY